MTSPRHNMLTRDEQRECEGVMMLRAGRSYLTREIKPTLFTVTQI